MSDKPAQQEPAAHVDENQIIAERRAKLAALRAKGNPFPNDFRREHLAADLHAAHDQTELVRRGFLTVHLDAAHRGLGTASCGPDTLPQYRVGPGTYVLSYSVGLVRGR